MNTHNTTTDKRAEKLLTNIGNEKTLNKALQNEKYYNVLSFINDAERYIDAIKEGRVICSIGSVSSSGMSRTIKFLACTKNMQRKNYQYLNFFAMFRVLGYTPAGKYGDYFRINGCGMDMIFHTNYSIIHKLHRLGFINKKQCAEYCQQTPQVI